MDHTARLYLVTVMLLGFGCSGTPAPVCTNNNIAGQAGADPCATGGTNATLSSIAEGGFATGGTSSTGGASASVSGGLPASGGTTNPRTGPCTDACVAGTQQCVGVHARACEVQANGCLDWGTPVACASGFCADSQTCGGCANSCSKAGASVCSSGQIRSCQPDGQGCLTLGSATSCSQNSCKDTQSCGGCTDGCATSGDTQCSGGQLRVCRTDANGCLNWSLAATCNNGCASATACGCQDECATFGATCNGRLLDYCVVDTNGCRRLISKECSLGCTDGKCDNCNPIAQPVTDVKLAEHTNQYAKYLKVNVAGSGVLAGIRSLRDNGKLPFFELSTLEGSQPQMTVNDNLPLVLNESLIDMETANGYLYAVTDSSLLTMLRIYDVSHPALPVPVGELQLFGGVPRKLSVSGPLACLSMPDGIHIIDVSAPFHPRQISVYPESGAIDAMQCHGQYAAVLAGTTLQVLDLNDPTKPGLAASMTITNTLGKLAFDGSVVYVENYYTGQGNLVTYRFIPPSTLTRLGQSDFMYSSGLLKPENNQLVGTSGDAVVQYDVSDPTLPVVKKVVAVPSGVSSVAAVGNKAYAVRDAVAAVDFSLASELTLVTNKKYLKGNAIQGTLAYLARDTGGFVIADVRDPTDPVVLSTTSIASSATGVALNGRYAYVTSKTDSANKLSIFDVSCPWSPQLVGSVAGLARNGYYDIFNLTLVGQKLYANCGSDLCVFDVSNPAAPTVTAAGGVLAGGVRTSNNFAIRGNTLYLASCENVTPVDITNPSAPVAGTPVALPATNCAGHWGTSFGKHMFVVADGDVNTSPAYTYTFFVIDISSPTQPVVVGTARGGYYFNKGAYSTVKEPPDRQLHADASYVYLSNAWGGVLLLDVRDPANPRVLPELYTRYNSRETYLYDRFLIAHQAGSYTTAMADQIIELCPSTRSGGTGGGTPFTDAVPPDVVSAWSASGAGGAALSATAISTGDTHTCAVLQDGTLRCWGLNSHGQVGTDTAPVVYEPAVVAGASGAASVSCGGNYTCARMQDGTARCWGANTFGQLGNSSTADSSTPVVVTGISTAVAVSAGARHACAVLADGTTRCWGHNNFGQVGNGTTIDSPDPVSVTTVSPAKDVVCGYGHTCALLQNGGVQCWGLGDGGQLGQSGSNTANPNPVTPLLFTSPKAVAVSAERKATTALFDDGTAAVWGTNGDLNQRSPYTMWKQTSGVFVTGASDHTCAGLNDGTLQCWGYNSFLQIGSGPPNDVYQLPTAVPGLGPIVAASTGLYHSCALLQNGSVMCWGYNFYGQLGQNGIPSSTTPVTVTGF